MQWRTSWPSVISNSSPSGRYLARSVALPILGELFLRAQGRPLGPRPPIPQGANYPPQGCPFLILIL
ncbi:hypothetical protein Barb4_04234 [Bacteroidales bacterium Barb4]|nr:hypothetical protein Barb4_04234 [Bacteroidales bacterium Barb4]